MSINGIKSGRPRRPLKNRAKTGDMWDIEFGTFFDWSGLELSALSIKIPDIADFLEQLSVDLQSLDLPDNDGLLRGMDLELQWIWR